MSKKPSADLEAKWLWATIGSGLDIGITVERMIHLLRPDAIKAVAEIAVKPAESLPTKE